MSKYSEQSVDMWSESDFYQLFDDWNILKKELSSQKKECFPKPREIWFVNFGQNLGCEMNGKTDKFWRPILVLKKLSYNVFLVIPLTSQEREVVFSEKISKNSFILLDQIRVLDKRRFIYKMKKIGSKEFDNIKYFMQKTPLLRGASCGACTKTGTICENYI